MMVGDKTKVMEKSKSFSRKLLSGDVRVYIWSETDEDYYNKVIKSL